MFVENIASFNQNLKYLVTEGSNLFEIKFTPEKCWATYVYHRRPLLDTSPVTYWNNYEFK